MNSNANDIVALLTGNVQELKLFEKAIDERMKNYGLNKPILDKHFTSQYWSIICDGLEILIRNILQKDLNGSDTNICILPSYSSILLKKYGDMTYPARIYTTNHEKGVVNEFPVFKSISAKSENKTDLIFTEYINSILNKVWNKIPSKYESKINGFTIHDFAQMKLRGKRDDGGSKRVPVVISNGELYEKNNDPSLASFFSIPKISDFDQILRIFCNYLNSESKNDPENDRTYIEKDLDLYVAYMILYTGLNNDILKEKVISTLLNHEINKNSLYKILSIHDENKFLNNIYFTTSGISDDLSDEPLGTIMIWTLEPLELSKTQKIHNDVFQYFDALRKIDYRISSSIEERSRGKYWVEVITKWAVHEIRSLTATATRFKDGKVNFSDFKTNTDIIHEISANIMDFNIKRTPVRLIDLITYLKNICQWEKTKLTFNYKQNHKNSLLIQDSEYILLELIRNAFKHSEYVNNLKKIELDIRFNRDEIIIRIVNTGKLLEENIEDLNKPIDYDNIPRYADGTWIVKWALETKKIGKIYWEIDNDLVFCNLHLIKIWK